MFSNYKPNREPGLNVDNDGKDRLQYGIEYPFETDDPKKTAEACKQVFAENVKKSEEVRTRRYSLTPNDPHSVSIQGIPKPLLLAALANNVSGQKFMHEIDIAAFQNGKITTVAQAEQEIKECGENQGGRLYFHRAFNGLKLLDIDLTWDTIQDTNEYNNIFGFAGADTNCAEEIILQLQKQIIDACESGGKSVYVEYMAHKYQYAGKKLLEKGNETPKRAESSEAKSEYNPFKQKLVIEKNYEDCDSYKKTEAQGYDWSVARAVVKKVKALHQDVDYPVALDELAKIIDAVLDEAAEKDASNEMDLNAEAVRYGKEKVKAIYVIQYKEKKSIREGGDAAAEELGAIFYPDTYKWLKEQNEKKPEDLVAPTKKLSI